MDIKNKIMDILNQINSSENPNELNVKFKYSDIDLGAVLRNVNIEILEDGKTKTRLSYDNFIYRNYFVHYTDESYFEMIMIKNGIEYVIPSYYDDYLHGFAFEKDYWTLIIHGSPVDNPDKIILRIYTTDNEKYLQLKSP